MLETEGAIFEDQSLNRKSIADIASTSGISIEEAEKVWERLQRETNQGKGSETWSMGITMPNAVEGGLGSSKDVK